MPDAVALAMVEALPTVAPTVGWQTIGQLTDTNGTFAATGAAVSTDGSRIYLSHGLQGGVLTIAGYTVTTSGQTFKWSGAPSVARQGVAGAWCNGKHYAIGGRTSGNSSSQIVETYTPAGTNGASGVWSQAAGVPQAIEYAAAAVIGNFIYLAGGYTSDSGDRVASFRRYDSTSNTWTTLASMPAARTQGAMVAVGSKLYYLGGLDSSGTGQGTIYIYDTTAGTWSTYTGTPTISGPQVAVAVGTSIYVPYGPEVGATYIIDTATGTRTTTTALPSNHGGFPGAVLLDSALYVVSGANTANVDKLDLGAGVGYTAAVLGAKTLLNPLLAGVAATLPNTPPTATADRNAYAQTVQTLKALTYIS